MKSNEMKKTLLLILPSLMFICSYGQCDINDIIPFKTGKTKFQTLSVVNSLKIKRDESLYPDVSSESYKVFKSICELNDGCNTPNHYWLKPTYQDNNLMYSYLKNDSMYISYSYLKWDNAPCLKGLNRRLTLTFADDTL